MRVSILCLPLFFRLNSEETLRSYHKNEKDCGATTEGIKKVLDLGSSPSVSEICVRPRKKRGALLEIL
ncbi:hypothetical protein COCON_G00183910 [Conger conger]|uniref:Uncharacterized protein n=1 Tax=Conger conger TaxID=82655 RepID=A0A9Q1HTE3_CONCO|nr:hypothetical protein COCON_G00183910 [Conger conger]